MYSEKAVLFTHVSALQFSVELLIDGEQSSVVALRHDRQLPMSTLMTRPAQEQPLLWQLISSVHPSILGHGASVQLLPASKSGVLGHVNVMCLASPASFPRPVTRHSHLSSPDQSWEQHERNHEELRLQSAAVRTSCCWCLGHNTSLLQVKSVSDFSATTFIYSSVDFFLSPSVSRSEPGGHGRPLPHQCKSSELVVLSV